jgi:S-adenosylmethionine/arginine decarboxylase-like enzyme
MYHFMMDGFQGARALLDDIRLVHELLEEVPESLKMDPVMPPFLLPYYTGAVPEDCGISAFVFLAGGHLTIHTFSVRECYFVDLVYPRLFEQDHARRMFQRLLPADSVFSAIQERLTGSIHDQPYTPDADFGPHLFLDIRGYKGATDLDTVFTLFEGLPARLGMTPIMRPYVIKGRSPTGRRVVSAMTMIAESHVALHIFPEEKQACFDIFSCRPFDQEMVLNELLDTFKGEEVNHALVPRGRAYTTLRTEPEDIAARSNRWLQAIEQHSES